MTRFAITTVAAFLALGATAASASDNGLTNLRAITERGETTANVASDNVREEVELRAGDVYTTRELVAAGLDADQKLKTSNFSGEIGQHQTRGSLR